MTEWEVQGSCERLRSWLAGRDEVLWAVALPDSRGHWGIDVVMRTEQQTSGETLVDLLTGMHATCGEPINVISPFWLSEEVQLRGLFRQRGIILKSRSDDRV